MTPSRWELLLIIAGAGGSLLCAALVRPLPAGQAPCPPCINKTQRVVILLCSMCPGEALRKRDGPVLITVLPPGKPVLFSGWSGSPFTASPVFKSKPFSVQGLPAPGRRRIYEWVIWKCNIKDQDPGSNVDWEVLVRQAARAHDLSGSVPSWPLPL